MSNPIRTALRSGLVIYTRKKLYKRRFKKKIPTQNFGNEEIAKYNLAITKDDDYLRLNEAVFGRSLATRFLKRSPIKILKQKDPKEVAMKIHGKYVDRKAEKIGFKK